MKLESAVLLMPDNMQAAALGGAAEILVEERPNTQVVRRYLHLFDDYERAEKIRGDGAAALPEAERRIHENCLKEFHWACATIWCDDRLSAFVGCPDPALWPALDSLTEAVDIARRLRRYESQTPTRDSGEDSLARALRIINREYRYAGVHPLKEVPVAGPLVPYRVNQWLRSAGAVKMSLPDTLTRSTQKADSINSVLLVEPSTPTLMASDVLKLPMTPGTMERLVGLLWSPSLPRVPPQDVRSTWHSLVAAHTRSLLDGAVTLVGSVGDAATALQISEHTIVQLVHYMKEEKNARVRLRAGVFITVIHREVLFLICGRHPKSTLSAEEKSEFERLSGFSYAAVESGGLAWLVEAQLTRDEVDKTVRERFLSPALAVCANGKREAALSDYYEVREVGSLGSTSPSQASAGSLRVYKATVPHNPFLVAHGPRVLGGPAGSEALSGLRKRKRDAEADADLQPWGTILATTDGAAGGRTPTNPTGAHPSSSLRGEALHAAIDKAVVAALASESMSKAELASHATLAPFARMSEFDRILKEALKVHAEYKNRKYTLRQ